MNLTNMKLTTTDAMLNLLLLVCVLYVKPIMAFRSVKKGIIFNIINADRSHWNSTQRESLITYMGNYSISEVIKSMNRDVQSILDDMPDELEKNLQYFQLLIGQIDDYFRLMVLYHQNYENLIPAINKNTMMSRCRTSLTDVSEGPVKLIHGAINFFAFGTKNFLDTFNQSPQVGKNFVR